MSKKQGVIALSMLEAKYISATSYCSQFLWIKNQLENYDIYKSNIPIFYDNNGAIILSKNPIFHSCAKHFEIIHN